MVLEDQSGRIRIKKTEKCSPDMFVTGSIVAFKGFADQNGFFEVKDYCFAGVPFEVPLPPHVNCSIKRELLDKDGLADDNRKFLAFVSGLEFGRPAEHLSYELLVRFFRGELGGPKEQKLSSQIQRIVICGNSIVQPSETDKVLRDSFRTKDLN